VNQGNKVTKVKDRIRVLIYDLELEDDPMDYEKFPRGWSESHKMAISTVAFSVVSIAKKDMRILGTYFDVLVKENIQEFDEEVKRSDVIMTHNGVKFDNVVMAKYLSDDEISKLLNYDTMIELKKHCGKQFRLDELGAALRVKKLDSGAAGRAIELFRSGKPEDMYELVRYNIRDIIVLQVFFMLLCNTTEQRFLEIDKVSKSSGQIQSTHKIDLFQMRNDFLDKFCVQESLI